MKRNWSVKVFPAIVFALVAACGCEVNNPPAEPTSSTTIVHGTPPAPNVTVNPPPTINVTPPAGSSHTETHTTTVVPPGGTTGTSSTQSSTTTTG